jgi:hypothetical protein
MKSNANALGQGEHWCEQSFTSASIVLRHKFQFTYGPWIRTKVDDGGTGGRIGGHFSFLSRENENGQTKWDHDVRQPQFFLAV